ncbi:MAG: hypothetical protein AAF961_05305, partial [Planctomycetota bacterium]
MSAELTSDSPKPTRPRLPGWLRVDLPSGGGLPIYHGTRDAVESNRLHTVCEEARCPNLHECWAEGD